MPYDNDNDKFEWTFTRQQRRMLDCLKRKWPSRMPLETCMQIWYQEIGPTIPLASVLYVYDFMKETGYYDDEY